MCPVHPLVLGKVVVVTVRTLRRLVRGSLAFASALTGSCRDVSRAPLGALQESGIDRKLYSNRLHMCLPELIILAGSSSDVPLAASGAWQESKNAAPPWRRSGSKSGTMLSTAGTRLAPLIVC